MGMNSGMRQEAIEREQPPKFTITEMTLDDIEPATAMRLQSWLDTYTSPGLDGR